MQVPALIEDPLRDGHNVASGTFRIAEVVERMAEAYQRLLDAVNAESTPSPLRCVLRTSWATTRAATAP